MQVSLDISLYALQDDYKTPVDNFLAKIAQDKELTLVYNDLSTQIYGDYDRIMALMTQEMAEVFQHSPDTVFVLKLVGRNRYKQNT